MNKDHEELGPIKDHVHISDRGVVSTTTEAIVESKSFKEALEWMKTLKLK